MKVQAAETIELSLEQLIACQYWANDKIPLPNKKTKAHLVGGHLSPFKGRGMEFSEVRQYQPGDDIRTIDWRVTARTGEVHTKIFQEERERPVFIVLDLQDSMFFGSRNRFKSTLACLQAARAFWTAFDSGNRVGALLTTSSQHIELKPSNRRKDGLRLLQKILELHNQKLDQLYQAEPLAKISKSGHKNEQKKGYKIDQTALLDSLVRLRHLTKGGCLIYLFSDFMDFTSEHSKECNKHLSYLAQNNDIYAIMLHDPLEKEIPIAGHYQITDGFDSVVFNASNAKRLAQYQAAFEQRLVKLQQNFIANRCYFTDLSTADPINRLHLNPLQMEQSKNAIERRFMNGQAVAS